MAWAALPTGWRRQLLRALARLAEGFTLLTVVAVLLLRLVPPPMTTLMLIRAYEGQPLVRTLLWSRYTRLADIAPAVQRAVIVSEDQKFARHAGFDFEHMWKVAWERPRDGKALRGASTITQQTAKNVLLWPARTYLRKVLEAWCTLWIELLWPKRYILELYLNSIEMGPGVFGIGCYAEHYFQKPPAKLNAYEAALLAACLPNPRRWNPQRIPWAVRQKQSWVLWQMRYAVLP